MFSLQSWYNSKKALGYTKNLRKILYQKKIPTSIQNHILSFILCFKCETLYTPKNTCFCWFKDIYYAQLIIIPEGEEKTVDNTYKLI